MIYIIPVGEKVVVNNEFHAMVIAVCIKKNTIEYQVQQTTDTSVSSYWVLDWEITSTHKKKSLIGELMSLEITK